MKIRAWQSLLIVIVFAMWFGAIEYQELRPYDPNLNGKEKPVLSQPPIYAYHLWLLVLYCGVSFISILFLSLNIIAKSFLAFGNLCSILLIEDVTWFVFRGKLMQSSDWTSQLMGYVDTGLGFVVPVWYIIGIPLVIGIWILVWKLGKYG